jgi:hypothetical protein
MDAATSAIHSSIQVSGLYRDNMLCNATMAALVRGGRLAAAEKILANMRGTPGLMGRPNAVSYTILIDGVGRFSDSKRAVQLLEQAEAEGVRAAPIMCALPTPRLQAEGTQPGSDLSTSALELPDSKRQPL